MMTDPLDILFFIGVILLLMFVACLLLRVLVVYVRGCRVIRHGILPRQTPASDTQVKPSGRCQVSQNELSVLVVVFAILAIHGLLTQGVWGLTKAAIGVVIIMGLGPLTASWFWRSANSDDVLARLCHRLLNWSVACLTFPILSLL